MTKTRKRKKKMSELQTIVIILALIFLVGVYLNGSLLNIGTQSIIGEEGYGIDDPLLANGQFNPDKFDMTHDSEQGDVRVGPSTSFKVSRTPCSSPTTSVLPVMDGYGYVESSGLASITRKNLRNINFKADVLLVTTSVCYHSYFRGEVTSSISATGWDGYTSGVSSGVKGTTGEYHSIELRWDDFESGHYVLLWDGLVVSEGVVPEGNDFSISIHGDAKGYVESHFLQRSKAYMYNMRSQSVFGCDTYDGEYLASKSFTQGNDFNLANLRGFKRFCTDIPSLHMLEGVTGTSNRIYYKLAEGDTVPVNDNEIWKVFYVADGSSFGINDPNCQEGEAYDYTLKTCVGTTGFLDVCPRGYTFDNGVCLIQVQNKIDYEMSDLLGANKAKIVFSQSDDTLHNGRSPFFVAKTPTYTGLAPSQNAEDNGVWYPYGGIDAWSLSLNNVSFSKGETMPLNDFFTATLEDVDAVVYTDYGDATDSGNGYTYYTPEYMCLKWEGADYEKVILKSADEVATLMEDYGDVTCRPRNATHYISGIPTKKAYQWQEVYTIKRTADLVSLSLENPQEKYDILSNDTISLKITNLYGKPFVGDIAVVYQDALGESYYFKQVSIPSTGTTEQIPARTAYLGTVRLTAAITLPLRDFSLLASKGAHFEYDVANNQGQTIDDLNAEIEDIINSTNKDIGSLADYINSLQLSLDEKASLISSLEHENALSASEKQELVDDLTSSQSEKTKLQEQLAMIKSSQQPSPVDTNTFVMILGGLLLLFFFIKMFRR